MNNAIVNNPHPIAKVFAPAVFLSLILLSLAFSLGPAQEDPLAENSPAAASK